jgi:hypothetical protein
MANIHQKCSSCHHYVGKCLSGGEPNGGEACGRFEDHLNWLSRQIDAIRRAESSTRRMLAVGGVALVFPMAAWSLLSDSSQPRQLHRAAIKVLTASASGGMTSTR